MRYVALLGGINVGGHRVKMTELRAIFEGLGFQNVATFIASGNVLFEDGSADASELHTPLLSFRTAMDEFHIHQREIYWLCRGKNSDSLVNWRLLSRVTRGRP